MFRTSRKRNANDAGENDDQVNKAITTTKCGLNKILRPAYRNQLKAAINQRSLMATRICALGSLLFLYKAQSAFDSHHNAFFDQFGFDVIKNCFYGVLIEYANSTAMPAGFRQFVEQLHPQYRFDWPNNDRFGHNGFEALYKTYTVNVMTNLETHAEKRLVEYLKLVVFKQNTNPHCVVFKYVPSDINNAVKFLIDKKDMEIKSADDGIKQFRRDRLIEHVQSKSWWPIDTMFDYDDQKFFDLHWLKSLPMWIGMQREIDEYNLSQAASQPEQPQPPKEPSKGQSKKQSKKSKKLKQSRKQTTDRWRRKKQRKKQMLDDPNDPPEIRNLVVIPICNFQRTHFALDNDALYRLLSQHRLLPRTGVQGGMMKFKQFMANKNAMWNRYFYMRKIRWFVRRKKQFDFRILSDGVAVSMQFSSRKSESTPLDLGKVRYDYEVEKLYKKALGIDPGYNKFNTTVQRDVLSGKEVSFFPFYTKSL